MWGGINPHRLFVGVFASDPLIHFEEIFVLLLHSCPAFTLDGCGKVEVNPAAARTDTAPLVANAFGRPRGNVAGGQVAEAGVHPLQVVIALGSRNLIGVASITRLL